MDAPTKGRPQGVDLSAPSAARICNWLLGGEHHWSIDRYLGTMITNTLPAVAPAVRANRDFVTRAVRYCAARGVRQFLVIGCGSPLDITIHDIANAADPTSRCVYVDADPISVAHTELMLDERGDPDRHDLIRVGPHTNVGIWDCLEICGVVDPELPMVLVLTSVLPFMPPGEDVETAIAQYKQLLPAGSYLIASHSTADGASIKRKRQLAELAELCVHMYPPISYRSRTEFTAFFAGLEVVEPGLVWAPQWRPCDTAPGTGPRAEGSAATSCILAAVGRKP